MVRAGLTKAWKLNSPVSTPTRYGASKIDSRHQRVAVNACQQAVAHTAYLDRQSVRRKPKRDLLVASLPNDGGSAERNALSLQYASTPQTRTLLNHNSIQTRWTCGAKLNTRPQFEIRWVINGPLTIFASTTTLRKPTKGRGDVFRRHKRPATITGVVLGQPVGMCVITRR